MTNLALEHALAKMDVPFARAAVGDRYVVEEMRKSGYNVGGEQSGHVVFLDFNTTNQPQI